jgi:hypothetical protein
VVVDPLTERGDLGRIEGGLFDRLAHGRRDRVLVAVPRAARQGPGAAFVRPLRAMLEHDPGAVGDQDAGRAEPAPMAVAEAADHPAVPVATHSKLSRFVDVDG